jgi:hypothetical protein
MEEIVETIKELKNNIAPGPDGLHVSFYKEFLDKVKHIIKEMLDEMVNGNLDINRINYGVTILLPKILDANVICINHPLFMHF